MPGFNYRMTELQAAVGISQIKKLNFILSESKKRFLIMENILKEKVNLRKIYKGSMPNFDTLIFKISNDKKRKKIVKYLIDMGIGTKNLPDAIKWHFAFFWKHAITKDQIKNTVTSKKILEKYIAIPIFLKKSTNYYKKISLGLLNLI